MIKIYTHYIRLDKVPEGPSFVAVSVFGTQTVLTLSKAPASQGPRQC